MGNPVAAENSPESSRRKSSLAERAVPPLVYLLVTWQTNARIMGDTLYYVDSILRVREGRQKFSFWEPLGNYSFYEFGHLLWRPFGYLAVVLYEPLFGKVGGATDGRVRVTLVLIALNWVAGLACVLLLQGLLRRMDIGRWISIVVAISFVCAHGFLNFAQTGSSYVPALASLLLGMYLLARASDGSRRESASRSWLLVVSAGFALACSVGFWFPFVWGIPSALMLPLLVYGYTSQRLLLAGAAALACGAFVLSMYLIVVTAGLGIGDMATLRAWVASSSHGLTSNRGVPQVILGLARSFIEMGNDNIIFKRFLLRDPYNTVSLFDLFRLGLWKLALFYLGLAAVVCSLAVGRGAERRALVLLAVGAVPVIVFAVLWQGTPLERYLPLYPAFFLATASALRRPERPARWLRPVVLTFMSAATAANVMALSLNSVNRMPEAAAERTRELVPLLRPGSIVVEVNEELKDLQWAYPLHPLNRVLRVYSAVSLGAADTAEWREDFARQALLVWNEGGDVWLSKRVLEERPHAASSWVEGADPRVRWADVYAFFALLDTAQTMGDGDNGFALVARTPRNEQLLSALAADAK